MIDDLNLNVLPDDTNPVLTFGKHAGTRINDVDRGYMKWMLDKHLSEGFSSWRMSDFMDRYADAIDALVNGSQARKAENDNEVYQLSPSQDEASKGIFEAFESGEIYCRLEGGAGYGKSFAVRDVVRNLLRTRRYYIQATAVSYVATQVLKEQLDRYDVDCATLARTLKLEKRWDGPREVYSTSLDTDVALSDIFSMHGDKTGVLLIDEYSMINDEYAKMIGQAASRYGGRLLVVGDLMQLPPVGQDTDTIFSSIKTAFTLTDPMRYSRDSNLYKVEQMVRANPWDVDEVATMAPDVTAWANSQELMEAFKTACVEHPEDDNRILFYQRQKVVDANNEVRKVLFGEEAGPLEPGEKLMVVRTSDYGDVRYYTGTTLDVDSVLGEAEDLEEDPWLYAGLVSGKYVRILFAVNENKADPTKPGGEAYNKKVKDLTAKALEDQDSGKMTRADAWKPLRDFKNSFVFVAYSYATTVHKSQGATVDRVFVEPGGLIKIPKVGKNLTYVAMTRAKRELHVC